MTHSIDISTRAAAQAETLADELRMEPEQVVEELLALASERPDVLADWLRGKP